MKRRVSVDLVVAAIIGAAVAVVLLTGATRIAYGIGRLHGVNTAVLREQPDPTLYERLKASYGPSHHSEDLEEWIIRDWFRDRRGGVFVDVGANDYQERNNTYYLETALGWSGVAVEPQTRFAEGYEKFRPRTTFVPLFVSDVSNQTATLYVPKTRHRVASVSKEFASSFDDDVVPTPTRTSTLDDILDRLGIKQIDFLNMDIELAEPQGLAGFSINRFQPSLVCIEGHLAVRERILEYFARHGYVLVGRYIRVDGDNFWFAPLGSVKDDPALAGK